MIVIGSQAILGTLADPPAELVVSREADIYPRDAPEKADLITGSRPQPRSCPALPDRKYRRRAGPLSQPGGHSY